LDASLGRYHTVVVTTDGDVYCWGSNLRGQCGPEGPTMEQAGSSSPNPVPTLLPRSLWGGLSVTAVTTGQFNTLLLMNDSSVWGFGRNFQGNLGALNYGFTKPVDTPVCVSCSLPGGGSMHRVVGFAAGSDHTMLLVKERAKEGHPPVLYGMGSNRFGQLGASRGTTTSPEPVALFHLAQGCAAGIGASDRGLCASQAMEYTAVYAGCDTTFATTARPQCPPGSSGMGGVVPCTPCTDGTISTLHGEEQCAPCPRSYRGLMGASSCLACPNGTDTAGEGAGEDGCLAICGIGTYGTLNTTGAQLPDDTVGLAPCVPCEHDTYSDSIGAAGECTPCPDGQGAKIRGMTNTSFCRAGCAPGSISSDGFSDGGQCVLCEQGKAQPNFRGTVCLTCAAGSRSLVGAAECTLCEAGTFGSLPLATHCDVCEYGTYTDIPGATACTACAVTASTRERGSGFSGNCTVATFRDFGAGFNVFGQLGVPGEQGGVTSSALLFANDVANKGGRMDNEVVAAMAVGSTHAAAVTEGASGALRAWVFGSNEKGELGAPVLTSLQALCVEPDSPDGVCSTAGGGASYNPTPTEIPPAKLGGGEAAEVRVGRYTTYVVTRSRALYSFGYNAYGQCGRSSQDMGDPPVNLGAGRLVQDVAAGWYHALVLCMDGTLLTFGSNLYGQLGVGTNAGTPAANQAPLVVPSASFGGRAVLAIAAGGQHSLVLVSDSNLYAFGYNLKGQLGVVEQYEEFAGAVFTPVRMLVPGEVLAMAAGGWHTLILTSAGLYGTGSNIYGQLADPIIAGNSKSSPSLIDSESSSGWALFGGSPPASLGTGDQHSVVVTEASTMWVFGSNRYGQLARQDNAGTWTFNAVPLELTVCDLEAVGCSATDYRIASATAGGSNTFVRVERNPCPPGFFGVPPFGRPGPNGICSPCPPGQFGTLWGQSGCNKCGVGKHASGPNATSCVDCVENTYAEVTGRGECTPCPGNTTMRGNGSSDAADCLVLCSEGSYSTADPVNGFGVEPCLQCDAGTHAPLRGALACSACAKGKYAGAGMSACADCGTNRTTRTAGSQSVAECLDMCREGYFGKYGVDNCAPCDRGTFTPGPGYSMCVPCGGNLTTRFAGDTLCLPACGPGEVGQFGVGPDCVPCGAGEVAGQEGSLCQNCSAGSFPSVDRTECVPCAAGTFQLAAGIPCAGCPAGKEAPSAGATACTDCLAGTYASQEATAECLACPDGFTSPGAGATSCDACGPGSFAAGGASACLPCAPGTFSSSPAASCPPCPLGTYAPAWGATSCEDCPLGTTLELGAAAVSQCVGFLEAGVEWSDPAQAGAPTRVALRFSPQMVIRPGESITVGLPLFFLPASGKVDLLGGDGAVSTSFEAYFANASLDLPFNNIRILARDGNPAQAPVSLEVPAAAGVRLPEQGTPRNNLALTLSTDARSGPVRELPINNSAPVGSFDGTARLSLAGGRLSVAFSAVMNIAAGEAITFELPKLRPVGGGAAGSSLQVALEGNTRAAFNASAVWEVPAVGGSGRLVLTVAGGGMLRANMMTSVSVSGVEEDPGQSAVSGEEQVFLWSDAFDGPVPRTAVTGLCSVASVYSRCCARVRCLL